MIRLSASLLRLLPGLFAFGVGGCASSERAPLRPSEGVAPPSAPVIQPGPPGEGGRLLDRVALEELPRPAPTEADIRFMQNMILHHSQALEMTSWVPERSEREEIRRLALRIELSQASEIAQMRRWLEDRWEEELPTSVDSDEAEEAHPAHDPHAGHSGMPGMLSASQLRQLREARGDSFDRLFLDLMIVHHEGALAMVSELFSAFGAAQGGEIYEFASHVDSDQRMEIERMSRLRRSLP